MLQLYAFRDIPYALEHTNGSIIGILSMALEKALEGAGDVVELGIARFIVRVVRSVQFIAFDNPNTPTEALVEFKMAKLLCDAMKRFDKPEEIIIPDDVIPFRRPPPPDDTATLQVPSRPNLEIMIEITAALSAVVCALRSKRMDRGVLDSLAKGLDLTINFISHGAMGHIALSAVEVRLFFFF
jgi:hypothetical protein